MQAQIIKTQNTNATVAVGKNDSVKAVSKNKQVAKLQTTTERIKALVVEREVWEHNAYVKSNEQLYALLDKCYGFYDELKGNDKDAKQARADLEALCAQKGYRFTESTHTLTKLVKYVFDGIDRRRVSAYSLVLREALAQGIKAGSIAAFINKHGGVEEIRRSKSKTAKTPKQKAELGKQAIDGKQLAVIVDPALALLAQSKDSSSGDDIVAILSQQDDGSFIVRHLITNKAVLNAALASAYSASKVTVGKTDSAANDDQLMEELLDAAANS